jgi:hypothetical protein
MADALTNITNLINSPPAQVVAGGALAGIVWKFFERVENVLSDQTKHEIARWLRVKNVESGLVLERVEPWPETFAKVFDRVFGTKHLSWKCFRRSAVTSYFTLVLGTFTVVVRPVFVQESSSKYTAAYSFFPLITNIAWGTFLVNVLPDYLSLLKTRFLIGRIQRLSSFVVFGVLLIDILVTIILSGLGLLLCFTLPLISTPDTYLFNLLRRLLFGSHLIVGNLAEVTGGMSVLVPILFTSIWIWLYASSGFILKAARRFDIGFDWFNRKFDIEKKPLQSIGLVAGCLVALLYWTAALIRHFVS